MIIRPRRLRASEILRKQVRETRISSNSLILPIFIKEGKDILEDIVSLEGQKRYSPDTLHIGIEEALSCGINSFIFFGIPKEKDDFGTSAYIDDGVVQQGIRKAKEQFGDEIQIITDVCLCEYTNHGHCGLIVNDKIHNDSSIELIGKTALSHARAGCNMVAPSDMMDGRIKVIRNMLDENGFSHIPIMSYAAKYSSSFYGPFRDAAGSAPQFGDRKTYQMDYHNSNEAIKEVQLDVKEGADIVMVKPALSYLDIINNVKKQVNIPVAAYSVSGEYAMIKLMGKAKLVDEYSMMCETTTSVFRAGADILITYYAKEISEAIKRGDIG